MNAVTNVCCCFVSINLALLAGAAVPPGDAASVMFVLPADQHVTVHPLSPSHFLTDRPPPLHHSYSLWRNLTRQLVMTILPASSQSMLQY